LAELEAEAEEVMLSTMPPEEMGVAVPPYLPLFLLAPER